MSGSKKITSSRELAKLAGVSHMTVSRAFRNDPAISSQTRERILDLAAKHGYQPNPIHTMHMRRKPKEGRKETINGTIAFIHNNYMEKYPTSSWRNLTHQLPIIEGIELQAAEYGFALDEFYVGPFEGGLSPKRMNGILEARGILGLIVAPPTAPEMYEGIDWDHHVAVTLTHSEYPPHLPRVSFDNQHTVYTCIKELHDNGYRRIGLCTPRKFDTAHLHVWSGQMLMHHGLHPAKMTQPLFLYDSPDIIDVAEEFHRWMDAQNPDAVVATDSRVRSLLEAEGLQIPDDIGIAHTAVERDVESWSGYKIDRVAQGKASVDLLMSRMVHNEFGIPESSTETLLRGQWQEGTTTCRKT